jgi:hypothetical protein
MCLIHAGLFLPASAWKAVRRAAADQLLELQQQHSYADGLAQTPVLPHLLAAATATATAATTAAADVATAGDIAQHTHHPSSTTSTTSSAGGTTSTRRGSEAAAAQQGHQQQHQQQQQQHGPVLRVLCRTPEQVSAALEVPWLQEVIVDFLEVHGLKEAVAAVQGAGKQVCWQSLA